MKSGLGAVGSVVLLASLAHCYSDGERTTPAQAGGSGGAGGSGSGSGQTGGTNGSGGDDGSDGGSVGGGTSNGGGASSDGGAPGALPLSEYALAFDGEDDHVTISANTSIPTGNDARTVEMWAYSRSTSWATNMNTLFEYGGPVHNQAFGVDMDQHPNMEVYTWEEGIVFDTGLPEEGWFHIATTYDGARTVRVYINGEERGEVDLTADLDTQSSDITIGAAGPVAFFDGMLDEIRIWNVARTQAQIEANLNTRLDGSEPGLVVYLRLDEGNGQIVGDETSQNNDGLLDGPDGAQTQPAWIASPEWAQ